MLVYRYAYSFGKKYIEPPKLVVRQIAGKTYYWNFQKQAWIRMTKRCPYLN